MAIMPYNKKYPDYDWHKSDKPATPPDPFALLRPFLQSWTVGFDEQFQLLEDLRKSAKTVAYPPYNIKEIEEGSCYEIEMAVAGFSKEDINLTVEDRTLKVEGGSKDSKSENYVHKGIAARAFTQTFALGEYVEVTGADLKNGILTITLERNLPEEKKPKVIEIN